MEVVEKTGRRRSGRKKVVDKKITVSIFPRMSMIELLGIENLKNVAITAVEKEYFKTLKK